MKNEMDILLEVAENFERLGIDYFLTGSFAMIFYAEPRLTRDIDLVARIRPELAGRLHERFGAEYYLPDVDALKTLLSAPSSFNLLHEASGIKVDVMPGGAGSAHEFSRRRRVGSEGKEFWIVSREDLILAKLAWSRDSKSRKQAEDIRNLLGTECDDARIEREARAAGLEQWLEEIRHGG